jgi:hypothetical protein
MNFTNNDNFHNSNSNDSIHIMKKLENFLLKYIFKNFV